LETIFREIKSPLKISEISPAFGLGFRIGMSLYASVYRDRFLLRLRERLQSIVINTSVCMSACLSAGISPEAHARSLPIFTKFLCMLPMAVAQVSFGTVTKSHGEGAVWVFLSRRQCIVQHSILDPYENG